MTSASALMDTVALMLFQNLREGMETGRIADVNTAQTEVEAAITELNRRRLPEGPTPVYDLVGKMLLEIGSLHEKVGRCETQLAEFQSQAKALKEDTTQNPVRTEACNLAVGPQQKENAKVLAVMEGMKAGTLAALPSCVAPAPSPTDPIAHSAPSRVALLSFPGGPRTVTIHPPDSPSYKSIIRDDRGDVIIDFRRTKPLRREGAFRGPPEDIDWLEITRVCGRGPDPPGGRAVPPVPGWPGRSQPSSCPPPFRGPGDLIARPCQLATSTQPDLFGCVPAPEHLSNTGSPSLSTGASSSSHEPSHNSQSSPIVKPGLVSTPSSTPPSPSLGRGRKRTRDGDDEGVSSIAVTHQEAPLPIDLRTIKEPTTPTPIKHEESHPPEGPTKRKRLRLSASSLEGSSTKMLSRMT